MLHRLHRGLDLVDRRDHDALDERVVLLDDAEHVEAADPGQADVLQDEIDVLVLHQRQRRLAARHRQHAVIALEDGGERVAHALIVVADQDGFRRAGHGGTARIVRPSGGSRKHAKIGRICSPG
jgi:hypothetical protein